jgi:hypothetical protein
LRRKAQAERRRSQSRRDVARILAAPAESLLGGASVESLRRRSLPNWPSRRTSGAGFARLFPDAAEFFRSEADLLLQGRLRLFGALHAAGGTDGGLDWNYHPTGDGFERFVEDVKFPWELSRHACFPRLGAAYYATGEDRYAEHAANLLGDWASKTAVGEGPAFASALEVGIRLIAWCQAFHFFSGSPAFGDRLIELLVRQVAAMAAWLDGHVSADRVVAGNHLLGELAGLIVTDLYFPELGERSRLGRNLSLFAGAVQAQVAPDGVSLEQSTTYGRFIGDLIAAVLATAQAAGTGVPPALEERALALTGWLAAVTKPDGCLPLIGDNDCGRGVDWCDPTPWSDARGLVMALSGVLGDQAPLEALVDAFDPWPRGAETVFWWLGTEGLDRVRSLLQRTPRRPALFHFPHGGHAVIKTGGAGEKSTPARDYVFVRCGPFGHGLPKPSAHSHADFMAPTVVLDGREVLTDPGNYGYTTVGPLRDEFRIDRAHSLFRMGEWSLAIPGATFRWRHIPDPGTLECREDDEAFWITGRWRPVESPRTVAASRTLIYNKAVRSISFVDEWTGVSVRPGYGVTWHWRLPVGASIEHVAGRDAFRVTLADRAAFLFELAPAGIVSSHNGWVAPRYGERIAAPIVVVERTGLSEPGGRQVTVLKLDQSPGEVSLSKREAGMPGENPS